MSPRSRADEGLLDTTLAGGWKVICEESPGLGAGGLGGRQPREVRV